jgi:hypothetical protein
MMTNLTWAALIFAALAAVACWDPGDRPGCDAARPVLGSAVCCERHRTACKVAFATIAELEAARRAESGRAEQP